MTKDLADELERLAKEATPGEWVAENRGGRGSWIGNTSAAKDWAAMSCGNSDAEAEANATLIVALRNALPEILSALRGEWQGIETSRKKHGEIVLLFDGKRVFPGYWGASTYDRKRKAYNHGWVTGPGSPECFPTHWRPLPPPPKGTDHE